MAMSYVVVIASGTYPDKVVGPFTTRENAETFARGVAVMGMQGKSAYAREVEQP